MKQRDVQGKIDFLVENFEKIAILKGYSFDELCAQFERVDSVIHRLQTSIEAILDIGNYIIADLGLRTPNTNAEVIEVLKEAGIIPEQDVRKYIQMVGFRNRVVHEYNSLDTKILYEILRHESDDLKILFSLLLETIKKYEEGRVSFQGERFMK